MAETVDPLVALEAKLMEAATNYQQNYYEISSDWHRYEQHELNYLKDYIGFAMFGLPEPKVTNEFPNKAAVGDLQDNTNNSQNNRENESTNNNENMKGAGNYVWEEKQQAQIQMIYDKVLKYANHFDSNGSIFCGIIYNVIFNTVQAQETLLKQRAEFEALVKKRQEEGEKDVLQWSEPEVQVYPVPVFKVKQIRKEITKNSTETTTEKIYYIDNSGRVYDGFTDYLDSNTLPICTMVYPKDGKYQMDQEFYARMKKIDMKVNELVSLVWLERRQSPADSTTAKYLSKGDTAFTIVSGVGLCVGLASFVTPIGPAVALAGGIGGSLGGLWGAGRSASHLADQGNHDGTINPIADKSAFGAWLGIVGGAAGLAASGCSAFLSRAIRTGATISRTATLTYDAVLVGNLIVNGVGISFKGYDMYSAYRENKEISTVDIVLFAGHLFFFSNSVVNLRFARTIIESSQSQLLKDYESSLRSNRHRKEFQRMARNTRAAGTNDVSSNEEIIRGINKISNRDEFFQAMVRNRKSLSASNARAAFSDGQVTVNSVLTIDPIEFASLPKDVRTEIIKTAVNPQTDISSGINTKNLAGVSNTFAGANAANSASKPIDVAANPAQQKSNKSNGVKSTNSAELKPKNNLPAAKPNNVAGTQPKNGAAQTSNSAEPKPNNSPTVPKESAGSKSNVPTGTQTQNSAGIKPNNFAGFEPNDPSESTSNIPAKPKLKASSGVPVSNSAKPKPNNAPAVPRESAGSKSNVATGTQTQNSGGIKPNNSAGIKPNDRSESTSNIPAQPKLKASSGVPVSNSAEPKPNNAPAVPRESAGSKSNVPTGTQTQNSGGIKPNNSAGIKPNDRSESTSNIPAKPKLKASSGGPVSNSAEPKPNNAPAVPKEFAGSKSNVPAETGGVKPHGVAAGVKTKIPPNETSYKNFDTSNRSVLNEFCIRHASTMLQTAPPQIADFANVLRDLRSVQNYAVIFGKLLEIGYKLFQRLPRNEEIVVGNVLNFIVEFLWDYVKLCIRRSRPGFPIDDPMIRKCLDSALQELWIRVEENIDDWIIAFKEWLRKTFPQSFNIPK